MTTLDRATDMALFVRSSDEALLGWNRQKIVDALLRETTIQKDIADEIGQEVEGIQSAAAGWELSRKHGVIMPITEQVYKVLYEGLPADDAVQNLLHRDQTHE